jgi:hypothetical protein
MERSEPTGIDASQRAMDETRIARAVGLTLGALFAASLVLNAFAY